MSTSKVGFCVQFRRDKWGAVSAVAMTKTKPTMPRRGSGSVVVQFRASIPSWVFDPLDLVAVADVPAENAEPLIRLDSVGPVLPETEEEATA